MGGLGRDAVTRTLNLGHLTRGDLGPYKPCTHAVGQSGTRRPSRLIALWVASEAIDEAQISNRFKSISAKLLTFRLPLKRFRFVSTRRYSII